MVKNLPIDYFLNYFKETTKKDYFPKKIILLYKLGQINTKSTKNVNFEILANIRLFLRNEFI